METPQLAADSSARRCTAYRYKTTSPNVCPHCKGRATKFLNISTETEPYFCQQCEKHYDFKLTPAVTRGANRIAQNAQDAQDAPGCTQTRPETSGRDTRAVARKRQPNKTEARYASEMLRGLDARYEAVTFRLSNGHRYTPDWVVFDSAGRLLSCHEVKGAYRFHSHGRARLAFDQAAVEFSGITWFWATLTRQGWDRRKA